MQPAHLASGLGDLIAIECIKITYNLSLCHEQHYLSTVCSEYTTSFSTFGDSCTLYKLSMYLSHILMHENYVVIFLL